MVNDTENDPDTVEAPQETSQEEENEFESRTGQIPLLDDVVLDTELPFPKPKLPNKAQTAESEALESETPESKNEPLPVPRPTDLFGGSPGTAQSGPLASSYDARDLDKLREDTEQMVDHLVAEYSKEIVSRLKQELNQELTSLLDDLNDPEKG